jgi:hypothetical protein
VILYHNAENRKGKTKEARFKLLPVKENTKPKESISESILAQQNQLAAPMTVVSSDHEKSKINHTEISKPNEGFLNLRETRLVAYEIELSCPGGKHHERADGR